MITDLSNTYIKVNSKEESEKIQKKVEQMGWENYSERVKFSTKTCIIKFYEVFYISQFQYVDESCISGKEITLGDLFGEIMTEESNLEKAKRLYPEGAKFEALALTISSGEGVKLPIKRRGKSLIKNVSENDIIDGVHAIIYSGVTNRWAEIISTPDQSAGEEREFKTLTDIEADKKMKPIRVSKELDAIVDSLVPGEVYQTPHFLFKLKGVAPFTGDYYTLYSDSFINKKRGDFQDGMSWCNTNELRKILTATPTQIVWLEECEEKGEYMTKDEALEHNIAKEFHVDLGTQKFNGTENLSEPIPRGREIKFSEGQMGKTQSEIYKRLIEEKNRMEKELRTEVFKHNPITMSVSEQLDSIVESANSLSGHLHNAQVPLTEKECFKAEKQQDPTNLNPSAKIRKPMTIKPTSKFSNLVNPKNK